MVELSSSSETHLFSLMLKADTSLGMLEVHTRRHLHLLVLMDPALKDVARITVQPRDPTQVEGIMYVLIVDIHGLRNSRMLNKHQHTLLRDAHIS